MARYRHYRNSTLPGATLFITTTVLDFVHAFVRDEPKDAMVAAIARECRLAGTALHAYVVMPHHIHLLVTLDESMTGPRFMRRLKRGSSPDIVRLLTAKERAAFDDQRGLNGNTFWKYSFRSVTVDSESMFWQKVRYIHLNPVRAGYVERPEDYLWSSSRLFLEDRLEPGCVIPYQVVMDSLSMGGDVA